MKKLIKKRNLFMSTTLMCAFLVVAFSFDKAGVHWFWTDNIPVAIILGVFAIILGVFWYKAQKKVQELRKIS